MGRDLAAAFAVAKRTFEEADHHLGEHLSALCFEGPADRLACTGYAQPAILAVSVAAQRVLVAETGLTPSVMAGHSLGEWSALVAADALDFADALRGVRERGRLMQEAVPADEGAMAAVIGLAPEVVAALCEEAAGGEVLAPANLNGAGQIVVAGHRAAVERLMQLAAARRARLQRLDVSAPFHCPLMAPAAAGVADFLAGIAVRPPRIPVVTSVEARPVEGPADIRALLVKQVTAPVRWEDTMLALRGFRPGLAIEVGPGRVLTGLAKRIWPDLACLPAGEPAALERVRELAA